jgi:hypothetical protein
LRYLSSLSPLKLSLSLTLSKIFNFRILEKREEGGLDMGKVFLFNRERGSGERREREGRREQILSTLTIWRQNAARAASCTRLSHSSTV